MHELDHILIEATASVEGHYFSLAVENGEDAQLERNYCYELFHQMRGRWPRDCPYTLNAEVDKRKHPLIGQMEGGRVIPDLLVHTPGAMAGNHAIIEIKRAETNAAAIRKDIDTLTRFMGPGIGYQRGVYLVFGGIEVGRIVRALRDGEAHPRIEIWLHDGPGEPARPIASLL